jgi:hypothetical protein
VRRAKSVDVKTKSVGGFYSEEAARIVSEAARAQQPAPIATAPIAPPAPPARLAPTIPAVLPDEVQRPPLTPEPAINQNLVAPRPLPIEDEPREPIGIGRIVAWIILAPWYLAMIAAAIGIDALFVKDLLGL